MLSLEAKMGGLGLEFNEAKFEASVHRPPVYSYEAVRWQTEPVWQVKCNATL